MWNVEDIYLIHNSEVLLLSGELTRYYVLKITSCRDS